MRQITELMAYCFYNNVNKSLSNTTVKDGAMYLFGNKIAWHENGKIYFSMCGYDTPTTRERLNGLGVRVSQIKGDQVWNGKKICPNGIYELK
jgi:hypothetical protein